MKQEEVLGESNDLHEKKKDTDISIGRGRVVMGTMFGWENNYDERKRREEENISLK